MRRWSRFRSRSEWNTSIGEWLIEKHGTNTRRSWRTLHVGMNADTGQIVAAALTRREVDDGSQVGPLLDQAAASVASFTADGAYDQDSPLNLVGQRFLVGEVIVEGAFGESGRLDDIVNCKTVLCPRSHQLPPRQEQRFPGLRAPARPFGRKLGLSNDFWDAHRCHRRAWLLGHDRHPAPSAAAARERRHSPRRANRRAIGTPP